MNPYLVAGCIIASLLLLIGFIVILKNSQLTLHRTFCAVTTTSALWIVTNYLSNEQSLSLNALRIANHLVLLFAGLLIIFVVKFIALISRSKFLAMYSKSLFAISYISVFLTLTPMVVKGISQQQDVYAIHFGPLAPFYFLMLCINIIIGLTTLFVGARKSSGIDRLRIVTILWSLGVMIGINLMTNALIPFLTGSFSLTNLGPITSVILVAGLAYSIVKHHMFDVRLVIARALGYVLSILTITAIYGLIALVIINRLLFREFGLDTGQAIVFMVLAVFLTLTFPPIKRFFDRTTRRIFYQDAYEPEVFLNQFNKTVTSTIQLDKLLQGSARTIEDQIKASYCSFSINKTSSIDYRLFGSKTFKASPEDLKHLEDLMSRQSPRLTITDLLEEQDELKKFLIKHDIALITPLNSSTFTKKQTVGYLILGSKKSGNPYSGQDERIIEIIAAELVIAIQNALQFEEIQQFNITLQERIAEATHELRIKNRKLHELDKAKDEFISLASHQLRTPLTTTKGYLSMMLEGDTGKINPQQKKILDLAYYSAQRMVNLITDMLNVSRMSTGKFVIERTPVNLLDVIKSEVQQLQRTAEDHHVKLVMKLPESSPTVMLDENKIRQVIMNFVDNALYYTPAGGEVRVELENAEGAIEFRVVDSGIGVSEHEKTKLFSKFFRAENAKQQRPDGTGLGLFMAKKVITSQGGSIIFSSRLGKGSTFGFRFALSVVTP